jgi:hypothetical protein
MQASEEKDQAIRKAIAEKEAAISTIKAQAEQEKKAIEAAAKWAAEEKDKAVKKALADKDAVIAAVNFQVEQDRKEKANLR